MIGSSTARLRQAAVGLGSRLSPRARVRFTGLAVGLGVGGAVALVDFATTEHTLFSRACRSVSAMVCGSPGGDSSTGKGNAKSGSGSCGCG